MKFAETLISIGSACRTRYQIDKFLGRYSHMYQPSSYFFDYLMMGELSGVINIIERNFAIKEADIFVYQQHNKYIPRDKQSGMAFLHDFGTVDVFWDSYEECKNALDKNMLQTLSKFHHLGQKTDSLLRSGKEVGLIYHGNATKEQFVRLKELLWQKYFKNFILINIIEDGTPASIDTEDFVITLRVQDCLNPKNGTPDWWQGWDESWQMALAQIPMKHITIS